MHTLKGHEILGNVRRKLIFQKMPKGIMYKYFRLEVFNGGVDTILHAHVLKRDLDGEIERADKKVDDYKSHAGHNK